MGRGRTSTDNYRGSKGHVKISTNEPGGDGNVITLPDQNSNILRHCSDPSPFVLDIDVQGDSNFSDLRDCQEGKYRKLTGKIF